MFKKAIVITCSICVILSIFVGCENKKSGRLIEPLYTPVDMKKLPDGTYRVAFTDENIIEENGEIYVIAKIYSEDIFDAVELHQMKPGDRIFYSGIDTLIEEVHWDEKESKACINFPSMEEAIEEFVPNETGGTYHISGPDDHHTYTFRGESKLKISDRFILTDSSEWGEEPKIVNKDKFKEHVVNTKPDTFWCLNTYLRVEDGEIIEMTRHYIP